MAEFVGHEECPDCSSSDNLARYSDGSASCFSPGCKRYEKPNGEYEPPADLPARNRAPLLRGETKALSSRYLTAETCKKFGYAMATMYGEAVQVAPYRDVNGVVVAQKTRTRDKRMSWVGNPKEAVQLFGQHLWGEGGRKVVVTEGEIDAMTVSQLQNNKWPVVSVPNGAGSSVKAIQENVNWLEAFDEVIFMFDGDEAGKEGAFECASVLAPGKAKIAQLPDGEDPNSLLKSGKGSLIIDAMWAAKPFRPDGLITLGDIREAVLEPPKVGMSWPWPEMTDITLGIRRGEVYLYGAGVGIGKTTAFLQIAEHTVSEHSLPVGLFFYEQPTTETGKRIAGVRMKRMFHLPNPEEGEPKWTTEELMEGFDQLEPYVHLYNHFGSISWEETQKHIRYLAKANNVKDFFIDHLTALVAHADDERRALDSIMAEVATLAQELDITIHLVSHLSTPDGTPHEEGGRVYAKHFTGSRAIMRWAHFMWGFERDTQAEDPEIRSTTTVRCLKARFVPGASGKLLHVKMDMNTGTLEPCQAPSGDDAGSFNSDF